MFGCMTIAVEPALCTRVLEKYGNCWLSSGTITTSFRPRLLAWPHSVPAWDELVAD